MKHLRAFSILCVAVMAVLAVAACSGHGPLGPSSPQGVVLKGSVLGANASGAVNRVGAMSATTATDIITVTVQEDPSITATVGSDGSFTLRGLPAGGFTLVFTQGGTVLGTLTFTEVKPNQEIAITIDVSSGIVVLVEEKRDGIGHGDIEIEGNVEQVLTLNPTGESRFLIHGQTVVAQPGVTAIREGNKARTVSDVTEGRHVHVKGVWLPLEGTLQPVLAHEIKLQGSEDDDQDTPTADCNISGGRVGANIELEGHVTSGDASSFMLQVNGNRAKALVDVDASGASFECHPAGGPNAPTPDQCRAKVTSGAQVHVSGRLTSCDASSASATASKIIVQK
jgi:hypothetical protein